MTTMWFVGIMGVDRSQRELRIWVCRWYPDLTLPKHYSFFACILHQLFREYGWKSQRIEYEEAGLLAKPATAPEILSYDPPDDTSQIIEHVEMVRWCGPSNSMRDDNINVNDDEYRTKTYQLQAEYLVRVADVSLISPRADPSFIGNFYFSTTAFDNWKDGTSIELGTYQTKIIHPPKHWIIDGEMVSILKEYALENLNTVDQLLDNALPILRKGPIPPENNFTPRLFHRLSPEKQSLLLSLLVYSKRDGSSVLGFLDSSLIFHLFSYLMEEDDENDTDQRKRVYISLQGYRRMEYGVCIDFNLLHETSVRHFGIRRLVYQLADNCNEIELRICEEEDKPDQQEELAETYVIHLKRIVPIIKTLDSKLFPQGKDHARIRFMTDRLEAIEGGMIIRDFIDTVLVNEPF